MDQSAAWSGKALAGRHHDRRSASSSSATASSSSSTRISEGEFSEFYKDGLQAAVDLASRRKKAFGHLRGGGPGGHGLPPHVHHRSPSRGGQAREGRDGPREWSVRLPRLPSGAS